MRLPLILLQFLLGLTILCGSGNEAAAGLSVEASLSHLAFPVDQGAMLSITVNGSGRHSTIELPEIEGIAFTGRGQASQMSVINGAISTSSTSNYLIRAEKPGVYTIPPIKVKVGGESAVTKAMSFEVTPAAAGKGSSGSSAGTAVSPGRSQAEEEAGFIRVSETGDHYPGEIVPVTIKAYFKERYRTDISSLVTMTGDGVVMPQLREKPMQTREAVSGETYNVLTWETTLAGIKEGRHQLSFSLEASLLVPQKRSSRLFGGGMFDDPMFNDPFFDSVFGGYQRRPVTVTSPPVFFNVVPLPAAGRPEGFSGAIGNFDLQVSANSREVEVGEPLTLTMAISGQGNFDRVEAPAFPNIPDWKTYSPTATFTNDHADHGTSGTKRFEQAIVARDPAVAEIPALSFSYFDPARKEYVTRTSSPITVKVKGSAPTPAEPEPAASTAATGPAAKKTAEPQQPPAAAPQAATGLAGLAPIHLQAGEFQPRLVPLWQKGWFLAVCGLCLILLSVLLIQAVRQHNRQKHPEIERGRQKRAELHHALQHIEQAKSRGDGSAFLTLCRTAIQNHLGPHWNMAPTAISLADLRTRLAPDSPLIEIFRAADEAAYGGAIPTHAKMQDYLDTLHRELEGLV